MKKTKNKKVAIITGITGQDGSYLAELLLEQGYDVYGIVRRLSAPNRTHIEHILDKLTLIDGDLLDETSLKSAVLQAQPDEVYNLAAQSFVPQSWSQAVLTGEFTALGVTRMLEAVRQVVPKAKFYQASSSEMFGKVLASPQTEDTPFYPRSPYGVAKVYGHYITVNYRESYDMFAVSGILFNHESPRRGLEFVTRKISHTAAKIYHGLATEIRLGNLDAKRDWGFAGDYVRAMWLMLQQETPDDFVISTGENHTVGEFAQLALEAVGIKDWKKYVTVDPKFLRPAEVNTLLGDASKAHRILKWEPKVDFKALVEMMVHADVDLIAKQQLMTTHQSQPIDTNKMSSNA